jgi:hypothetical protein
VKKVVIWTLFVIAALAVVYAVSWPFVIGALDEDIAARNGHPFKPITPAPGQPGGRGLPILLGTGGLGCLVGVHSDRFTTTDRIRLISDEPPGGGDVMIELFPFPDDGGHPGPSGYPSHPHFEPTAVCVSEDLSQLSAGADEARVHVGDARATIDFEVVEP